LTGTGALIGGVLAEAASLDGALPAWCYLAAVGLLLSYVDARLRVLPKQIIGPSYVVVAVLLGFAAFQEGTPSPLVHAALGCALMATVYFVLWFIYPAGMGFGDVRLAGLLGMGLGYLGWAQVIVGLYAGFVLGGVGGLMLLMLQRLPDRHYAFGPFMVTGALLGAGAGGALVHWWYSFVMR
jgi:leader peptidase (prepilin peptidase)/N-methyltransferase